jgi:hypothetical protein
MVCWLVAGVMCLLSLLESITAGGSGVCVDVHTHTFVQRLLEACARLPACLHPVTWSKQHLLAIDCVIGTTAMGHSYRWCLREPSGAIRNKKEFLFLPVAPAGS